LQTVKYALCDGAECRAGTMTHRAFEAPHTGKAQAIRDSIQMITTLMKLFLKLHAVRTWQSLQV